MNTSPSQEHSFPSSACDAFELRLNEILDERLDPQADEVLTAHVAECVSCRRRMRTSHRMLASFHAPPGGDVATALSRQWARRIADQHAAERQVERQVETQVQPAVTGNTTSNTTANKQKKRRRPSPWLLLLSTSAAAVAMAVTLQLTLNRRGDVGSGVATSPNGTEVQKPVSASMVGSTLALGHAAPPDWAKYRKTWQAWESALDPEGTGRESLESSVESSVEPIADSFVPVGQSFSTVLGGLRKTLPANRVRQPKTGDGAIFFWERWSVV